MPKKQTRTIPIKKPEPPPVPKPPKADFSKYKKNVMFGYNGRSITIHLTWEEPDDPDAPQVKREGRVLEMRKKKI